jgi:hypothetical protein
MTHAALMRQLSTAEFAHWAALFNLERKEQEAQQKGKKGPKGPRPMREDL